MPTNRPHTTGETLEQILERVIFENPATHGLRDDWERTKAEEQAVYDRICLEEYERRLNYHRICRTPDPEGAARHETNLSRSCSGKSWTPGSPSGGRQSNCWCALYLRTRPQNPARRRTGAVTVAVKVTPARDQAAVAVQRQHAATAAAITHEAPPSRIEERIREGGAMSVASQRHRMSGIPQITAYERTISS
jgi:hypothetical protein